MRLIVLLFYVFRLGVERHEDFLQFFLQRLPVCKTQSPLSDAADYSGVLTLTIAPGVGAVAYVGEYRRANPYSIYSIYIESLIVHGGLS